MFTKEVYDKISYIRATLRNRLDYVNEKAVYPALKQLLERIEPEERVAYLDNKVIPMTKVIGSWTQWMEELSSSLNIEQNNWPNCRIVSEESVIENSDYFVKERLPAIFEVCSYLMYFLGYDINVSTKFRSRILSTVIIVFHYLNLAFKNSGGIWTEQCDSFIEWGKGHIEEEWMEFDGEKNVGPIYCYVDSLPIMDEITCFYLLKGIFDFVDYSLKRVLNQFRIIWLNSVYEFFCSEYREYMTLDEMKRLWKDGDYQMEINIDGQ